MVYVHVATFFAKFLLDDDFFLMLTIFLGPGTLGFADWLGGLDVADRVEGGC